MLTQYFFHVDSKTELEPESTQKPCENPHCLHCKVSIFPDADLTCHFFGVKSHIIPCLVAYMWISPIEIVSPCPKLRSNLQHISGNSAAEVQEYGISAMDSIHVNIDFILKHRV